MNDDLKRQFVSALQLFDVHPTTKAEIEKHRQYYADRRAQRKLSPTATTANFNPKNYK